MTTKAKRNFQYALYTFGALMLGGLGVFFLWAILWIGYILGFKM